MSILGLPVRTFLNLPKAHRHHYFGGLSFLVLILQLATGIFLIFFYDPTLNNAYNSVQYLTNKVTGGSLLRNLHRWIAFSLFLVVLIHTIRSTLRKDFMNPKKRVAWLTGILLLLPIFLFTVTGIILPWEWKGYWFMEMIPNYSESLPFIGPTLKSFFINSFTLPRYFVIHILILPIISLILLDYHFLNSLRIRGIFKYIFRHALVSLPFIIMLFVLAMYITIPSEDPDIIPMPLEGEYMPAPEWYFLIILLPFLYFKGNLITILSIYLPFVLFITLAFLPYYLRGKNVAEERNYLLSSIIKKVVNGLLVILIFAVFASLIYLGAYNSPTLGCNSCHNLARGQRMGVPPQTFKNRSTLPNLNNSQWMMGHWFYPTIIW